MAEKRLNAEVSKLCRGLSVGQRTEQHLSVTGEPYVEITSGGVRNEAEPMRWLKTGEQAVNAFLVFFEEYTKDHSGAIYWRWFPELVRNEDTGGFSVYSRVLISNKPPLTDMV